MRIIFFGEDSFSAAVLNSLIQKEYQVVMVATPYYDDFVYKRLELIARNKEIPFFREVNINSASFIETVRGFEPDIIVTAHFKKLLVKELIAVPKICCLNLHPSLLPRYRGMSPQHWPIINGDSETGLTVHYIEEGIDTGNILVQETLPILPDSYVFDLQKQMLPYYGTIVVDAIKRIESGDRIGDKQDISTGSFYGKFKPKDAEINGNTKKAEAYGLIRAISKPYMGAHFGKYKLWKAHPAEGSEEVRLMEKFPGIGLYFGEEAGPCLRLQDGVLIIDSYEQILNT